MRVTCDLFTISDGRIALEGPQPMAPLWSQRLDWQCRDRRLDLQVVGLEPVACPSPEPTEPPEGALARVVQAVRGTGGLVLLRSPAEAFGAERMSFADGARLLGIRTAEDEACWDLALSLGRPTYGVRGRIACDIIRPGPASVLSALAYGAFTCEEGLSLQRLDEDRVHVGWDCGRSDAVASVIIRNGYEAISIDGAAGEWRDQGTELYVRVVVRAGQDRCWTQPRFIAPRVPA